MATRKQPPKSKPKRSTEYGEALDRVRAEAGLPPEPKAKAKRPARPRSAEAAPDDGRGIPPPPKAPTLKLVNPPSPPASPERSAPEKLERPLGSGMRGPLQQKLVQREMDDILSHLKLVGRVTACELSGVTYPRFNREMKTNPDFAVLVHAAEAGKDEMAEAVIFNGVLRNSEDSAIAYLKLRLSTRQLNEATAAARHSRKIERDKVDALKGLPPTQVANTLAGAPLAALETLNATLEQLGLRMDQPVAAPE